MEYKAVFSFITRQFNKFIYIPLIQRKFKGINILTSKASIEYILKHNCSVSRFGDGEFDVLMGKDGNTFQKANALLAERLKTVLTATDAPNHIVGLPYPLKSTKNLRPLSRDFWGYYVKQNIDTLLPLLSKERTYVDTQLSRFYIAYNDKSHCQQQFELLKKIWQDRDILIVEGTESRTGVGNDLYDNTRSIKRILGPATNAFDKYDEMYESIIKHASRNQLILLSYGMCATVLAYDLAKMGYQAIDIGHLDIEYEWMRMGAKENTPIRGKFTNEAGREGRECVSDCNDQEYKKQIICVV